MRRLVRFLGLTLADRLLVVRSLALLLAARAGLWLLPYPWLWRLVAALSSGGARRPQPDLPRRVAWALGLIGPQVPSTTCLPKALAAVVLLSRGGWKPQVQIGVARDGQGDLEAHAWVECDERVVIGSLPDLSRYTPLATNQCGQESLLVCGR